MKTACKNQVIHHCTEKDFCNPECGYIYFDDFWGCNHMNEDGNCGNEKAWPENQEAKDDAD